MSETIRNIGKRWFEEVWNKRRREAIHEMLAPDGVLHDGDSIMRGPDDFYPFFDRMQATFPDLYVTVEDIIVEGDKICVRWSATMTHAGDGLGMPATGKVCKVTGLSLVREFSAEVHEFLRA